MKLSYGTQLSPSPIKLSIGTLKKPKLADIGAIGFETFSFYEMFLKMTPELFFTKIKGENGKIYWDSLSYNEQENITMFGLIINDKSLQKTYTEIFNFFFAEQVIYSDGLFILINNTGDEVTTDDVVGVITKDTFLEVIDIMAQTCGIYSEEDSTENVKFKNNLAKKLYEQMKKAKREQQKRADINLSLYNIVSAVSNRHPTINPINVWELTVFQLLDSFNRMQVNSMYDIDSTRVSVWGDEKKTFNAALWYKNEYER